jgi:hypothetical protein
VSKITAPASGARWPGEAVEQRRLAGAGFADDAHHLARPQIEGDIGTAEPRAIALGDAAGFEAGARRSFRRRLPARRAAQ